MNNNNNLLQIIQQQVTQATETKSIKTYSKSEEQAGFSNTTVTNQQQFKQVITETNIKISVQLTSTQNTLEEAETTSKHSSS